MSLIIERKAYKPFSYPWAYTAWHKQQQLHWLPEEVPLADDIRDWKYRLDDKERNLLTQIFRFFVQADVEVNNCLVEGSEILTPTGWKSFESLVETDRVAEVTKDRTVRFVKPSSIIKQEYTGNIHYISNRTGSVQIAVTDNHRMVYSLRKDLNTLLVEEMNRVNLGSNYFHHTAALGGGSETRLSWFDKLVIAYQADGSRGSANRGMRFEFSKDRKKKRIEEILYNCNLEYTIASTAKSSIYYVHCPIHLIEGLKTFDRIDLSLVSSEWCKEFVDELGHWDGTFKSSGVSYTNTNKEAIDKVSAIGCLAGYRTRLKEHNYGARHFYKINIYKKYNPTCGNCLTDTIEEVHGVNVYCVSVPSGMILTRYKGAVSITGNCYMKKYSQVFKPTEIQMMLSAFSNAETIHIAAYSYLLDTIGMPETEYEAFLHYKEMKDKYDYMQQWGIDTPEDVLKTLAVFGGFTEGLQLFASFAMLLNFTRFNKMKGMGQIITWSVRDETLHTNSILKLLDEWRKEFPQAWNGNTTNDIYTACKTIVRHEDEFIKLAFEMGDIEGLKQSDMHQYIRYIANRRLTQMGLAGIWAERSNPLPWMDEILNGVEHANFFESRSTEYSKAATKGNWNDVF